MVLTTTNSAGGEWRILEGTAQEVLDALDAQTRAKVEYLGRDGAGAYYALIYLK